MISSSSDRVRFRQAMLAGPSGGYSASYDRLVADGWTITPPPEPEAPVGQRRRAPDGAEVILTDDDDTAPWVAYRSRAEFVTGSWLTHDAVAGWEVITDHAATPDEVRDRVLDILHDAGGPMGRMSALDKAGLLAGTTPAECEREHLPDGHVPINLSSWERSEVEVWARDSRRPELRHVARLELDRRDRETT